MISRREHLEKGREEIDSLERELARAQAVSKRAKRKKDRSEEELTRVVSTGLSFAEVLDDLGVSLHEAMTAAMNRLSQRK